MQHNNKGDVEGTGTWMAAWRPLTSGETQMPSERPYPGQLWKRDSTQVIIVAVHLNPGFKWSSQHLERGGCDGEAEAAFGSVRARRAALAWSALCCAA